MTTVLELLDDFTNPSLKSHRQICRNAGIMPGITNSILFCKYLKENTVIDSLGNCDWCTLDNNKNYKLNKNTLKTYRKSFIKYRAGERVNEVEDKLDATSTEIKKEMDAANVNIQNAKSNEGLQNVLRRRGQGTTFKRMTATEDTT